MFNRELLRRFDAEEVQLLLDDALTWIENASLDKEFRTALESRLIFRQEFLHSLQADRGGRQIEHHIALACLPLLSRILETAFQGRPASNAFSPRVQRSLASSMPPRPIVTISFEEALAFLKRLCHDINDTYQLRDIEDTQDRLVAYWTFMAHKPVASAYARALGQHFLPDEETIAARSSLEDMVLSDLRCLAMPVSFELPLPLDATDLVPGSKAQLDDVLHAFAVRCSSAYVRYLRTACFNRCRVRRSLLRACIDWDNLQVEAEELDEKLRHFRNEAAIEYSPGLPPTFAYPLSSWVYHYKLLQIEQAIQMGFELTVYAPDELSDMYFHLSQASATHIAQLDRMSFFVEKQGQVRETKAHTRNVANVALQSTRDRTQQQLFRIFTQIKAMEALARGLHRLYTVLNRRDLLLRKPRPYSCHPFRYDLRLKQLLQLSIPEPINHDQFRQQSLLASESDAELLGDAAEAVGQARKLWEAVLRAGWSSKAAGRAISTSTSDGGCSDNWIKTDVQREWTARVKDALRACIATSIAIGTLSAMLQACEEDARKAARLRCTVPGPGTKNWYHDWWIVPTIETIK